MLSILFLPLWNNICNCKNSEWDVSFIKAVRYVLCMLWYLSMHSDMYACINGMHCWKKVLDDSKKLAVITGAGISTESGIPDYRRCVYHSYEICFIYSSEVKMCTFALVLCYSCIIMCLLHTCCHHLPHQPIIIVFLSLLYLTITLSLPAIYFIALLIALIKKQTVLFLN
jgi:hypothetical protein